MICIKIEMWPKGDESKKYDLGRAYIANVGGTNTRGDYDIGVCRAGTVAVPAPVLKSGPKAVRSGSVKNYPRLSYNMWRLIIRALVSAFPEEAGKVSMRDEDEDTGLDY